jgi:glycosyltransferase involved in cell wall biosynthesis
VRAGLSDHLGALELTDGLNALITGSEGVAVNNASVAPRRAVLVVGSHRSGTSALARVLSLVGCDLPKHVMPPLAGSNELGFWEPEAVVQAHEDFLAKIGSSWDDVSPLADGAFVSAPALDLRRELVLLLGDEYRTSRLFVVKDPRISRLLPLWFAVLSELQVEAGTAIAVRNPLEVAASLRARDGFTTTKSLLLWLRHALEAEEHARGRARSFVAYDELLRDWQGVLAKVGEDLGITWPGKSRRAIAEVENFLSERHRHHAFDWTDLEGRAEVVSWVKEAYFALRASNPGPILDQIRDELSRADTAFGPIVEETQLALEASHSQLLEATAARAALAAELEARDAMLEARRAEVHQLQGEVAQLAGAVGASGEQIASRQIEVDALRAQRDGFAREVEVLAGEVERLATAVASAQSHASAAEGHATFAREELAATRAEAERMRAVAQSAASRVAALEADAIAERGALLTSLEAARADAEELGAQLEATKAELGALAAQTALERAELLRQLHEAHVEIERLSARVFAAESEAAAGHARMLSDLDNARSETNRLAVELGDKSREADELALASRAAQDRAEAAAADAMMEQSRLLMLIERLEAALESERSGWQAREEAASAAIAREAAARRVEFDAERSKLLAELDAARAGIEASRSELEFVRDELSTLKANAASDRVALITERDGSRAEEERLVAELEAAKSHTAQLAVDIADLETALDAHRALVRALQSVTKRRNRRWRSMSQLGTWLLPPTPRKLNYLRRYLFLRWSGEFDADSYLLANLDVLEAGLNPLMHYVQYGRSEGRQFPGRPQQLPSVSSPELDPSVATASDNSALNEAVSADAEQAISDESPEHTGEARGDAGDEHAAGSFDASALPTEVSPEGEASGTTPILTDEVRATLDGEFDGDYYRGNYEDIDRVAIDPLEHYFYTGWREGRDPSPDFSTSYYLSSNPDVADEEVNPLLHYVLNGRREGRQPYPPTGFRRQTLQTLRSLDEEISHWQQSATVLEAPMDGASLAVALADRIGARRHAVVSCSHDNYTQVVGGAQLCVSLEQEAFVGEGCAYINLHPACPLPVLSRETQPEALDLCVLCDGEGVGSTSASAVIAALSNLQSDQGIDFGLVVHALHGHSPEVVIQLHHHLAPRWAWLWLHDYFAICPNANLLRNRIEPCGAPRPDSPGCTICLFGEERLKHLPRLRLLLETVPFNLVAPSQFMADRWKQYFGNDQLAITVHENGRLIRASSGLSDIASFVAPAHGPVRVAFLGLPAIHKGWGVFLDLARQNAASMDYRFFHFGDGRYRSPNVATRIVNVLEDGPLGMIRALRDDSIDLAVVWSLWEESFSYTAHEALAAGVVVLTNNGSGNIARIVAASDDGGLVFGDESELFASFDNGLIADLVRARRKNRNLEVRDFSHSRMTADLANFR